MTLYLVYPLLLYICPIIGKDYSITLVLFNHRYRKVLNLLKKHLIIWREFKENKYEILATFLELDVLPFEEWIKSSFESLSGESEYEEVNGNVCCAEISPQTTKVYDNLAEDAMENWCEVDTKELRQLIDEWCDKVMSITTKPIDRLKSYYLKSYK